MLLLNTKSFIHAGDSTSNPACDWLSLENCGSRSHRRAAPCHRSGMVVSSQSSRAEQASSAVCIRYSLHRHKPQPRLLGCFSLYSKFGEPHFIITFILLLLESDETWKSILKQRIFHLAPPIFHDNKLL